MHKARVLLEPRKVDRVIVDFVAGSVGRTMGKISLYCFQMVLVRGGCCICTAVLQHPQSDPANPDFLFFLLAEQNFFFFSCGTKRKIYFLIIGNTSGAKSTAGLPDCYKYT